MEANTEVRLKFDPSVAGFTTGESRQGPNGELTLQVKVAGQRPRWFPESQLEIIVAETGPIEDLRDGKFSGPDALRTSLIHIRLSGRLADMIYSMESTNTDFMAYQFKPVVKMVNSPSGGLLIADEVGLGKTIEAGLVWTELRARFDAKNLLVLCPLSLTEKWRKELSEKFDIDAPILKAGELLEVLQSRSRLARGGAYICARDSIRPDRGWDDSEEEYGSKRVKQRDLALRLQELADGEPVFDLVIMDEAHHLRNPSTQSHKIAELVRSVAEHAVFLSATPIHLRNRDLFAQLKLLDPGAFVDQADFEALIAANNPVVAARETVLHAGDADTALEHINEALDNPLLSGSSSLKRVKARLSEVGGELSFELRADLAAKLDSVNLLSNLVTRTRRRDVKELAIIRRVQGVKSTMTEIERTFYEEVEQAVTRYAFEKDINHRFLLASPLRMLTSSMAAALKHWRRSDTTGNDEAPDLLAEVWNANEERPLIEYLRNATKHWNEEKLVAEDTKYDLLVEQLTSQFEGQKVVLFSTFKPTLNYLESRLRSDGLTPILIHGDVKDRDAKLTEFRERTDVDILLSSEVGSEGLDLQFCRVLMNYDLPWNPMKVEQRIGRVDRFGQQSPFVEIRNFLHANTIDEQIWDRLYDRLHLCEQALGGFEDILGEQVRELETHLAEDLSEEEKIKQIEQTSLALQNNRLNHDELEKDAAGLIAHGDYILNKVQAAHEFNRWLTPSDLQSYLIGFFAEFYKRSKLVVQNDPTQPCSLTLDADCREDFRQFCQTLRISLTTSLFGQSQSEVLFGKPNARSRLEVITQQHPLVRFAAHRIESGRDLNVSPAVACHLDSNKIALPNSTLTELGGDPSGLYLITVQRWSISGITEVEKLVYVGQSLGNGALISADAAEVLATMVIQKGQLIEQFFLDDERDDFANTASFLFGHLNNRYSDFREEYSLELEDRANFQLRSLERHELAQKNMINDVLEKHQRIFDTTKDMSVKTRRGSLIKAQEGKLRKLAERIDDKRQKIERSKSYTSEAEDVAAILLKVG